ncbi:MAG: monofunctional biosynthetic peptidoglycan transglycosylase, partial [Alphaproteobacteria bacterium]
MLIVIAVVLLLPYLLVPLYRVVNPVSTLMLWRWANGARVESAFVPIASMAPSLPTTVIAA